MKHKLNPQPTRCAYTKLSVICRKYPTSSPNAGGLTQLECRREKNRGFQGLIRWHAKCIKFCRHFNSNMLDSWVSPEAAGFFISFTEGQSPLLPAPLLLSAVSLSLSHILCPFLSMSPSLFPFLSLSYFFGVLSPSLLLCACKIKDQSFVSSPVSGNSRTPCGLLAQRWVCWGFPLSFLHFVMGKICFPPFTPQTSVLSPLFYFCSKKKKKRAGKESIWHMNN